MAFLAFCFIGFVLVSAIVSDVTSGREFANFPLADCSTGEMDVLCLFYHNKHASVQDMCPQFASPLLSFSLSKTSPRILFAGVYDWFSVDNPNVNVSSWSLHESPQRPSYGSDQQATLQDYDNVNEMIELKVKFVQHLFSEMAGVRENATHIAVVFIDGRSLSFDERRSVPQILQQQDTDVKIFAVVLSDKYEDTMVHLRDTLLVNINALIPYKHLLVLVMCNQCLEGWWMFEHSTGAESLSCYKMFHYDEIICKGTLSICVNMKNESLVKIESTNEMTFLRSKINSYLNEIRNPRESSPFIAHVFIGLFCDPDNVPKKYNWRLGLAGKTRPLVVNNWLPGKPSDFAETGDTVWRFDWTEEINNDTSNVSKLGGQFVNGWDSFENKDNRRFVLLEASITRRLDLRDQIIIRPATNESFIKALNSGGFVKFRNNLVSVSFNFDNYDFIQFLQQTGYETFPVFDCGQDAISPRYISYSLVCNEVNDCSNIRDENMCHKVVKEMSAQKNPTCSGVLCNDRSCLSPRWVNDGYVDCFVFAETFDYSINIIFTDEQQVYNDECVIYCNFTCIRFSQLNDGIVDCTGWEGPLDKTFGKLEGMNTCLNLNYNFFWSPKCVYVIDKYGDVLGCRDKSHLLNCVDFECPLGYVKCPGTYCIPQQYVWDEKEDCPTGEDEQVNNIGQCTGNFACWNSKICLYPDHVCDGHPECPLGDDEVDCNFPCVEGFRCVSGSVTVSTYNQSVLLASLPEFDNKARYVDLSGVDLSSLVFTGNKLPAMVTVIRWSHCNIHLLDYRFLASLLWLQDVDFSYNRLQIFDGRDDLFVDSQFILSLNLSYNTELVDVKYLMLARLETLDISHTSLFYISPYFLKEFPVLKYLDLSFTSIRSFNKNVFPSNLNLQTLDLRGIQVDHFYEDFFNGLTVSQDLYTDSFEMCCLQIRGNKIPLHTCHAPADAISTCFDLLGVNVQRVLLLVVAVLAVLGNVTVIVYRVIWDSSVFKTGYGLFVTNLGISDFIMGVYLFIIAGADYYYRGVYVLYDMAWRESPACRLAGFLATLSSETSIFFVFLITLDRFLVMKFPFGQVKLSKTSTSIVLCLCWLIGFLLALTPVVSKSEVFSSNAMCVGLPLTTKRLRGWEFSFGVFIAFNLLLCVVIAGGQRAIFRAMSENRISGAETSTSPRRAADIMVAKQLSLVALSNFLCWFPVGIMGLLSLNGHEISNDVYAWTTIIVLPINSAANPLLYTIPVLMDKWDKFKFGRQKSK